MEDVVGSRFADTITGNAKSNRLWGGAGDDSLSGLDGADTLRGQAGALDSADGGKGVDFCRAESRAFCET